MIWHLVKFNAHCRLVIMMRESYSKRKKLFRHFYNKFMNLNHVSQFIYFISQESSAMIFLNPKFFIANLLIGNRRPLFINEHYKCLVMTNMLKSSLWWRLFSYDQTPVCNWHAIPFCYYFRSQNGHAYDAAFAYAKPKQCGWCYSILSQFYSDSS